MSLITTEHRLRCEETTCWVTLARQEKWSVVSVEFADGEVHNVVPEKSFETEDGALAHAKTSVCNLSDKNYC